MSNTKQATAGDLVKYLDGLRGGGVTPGKIYPITGNNSYGGSTGALFVDDKGSERAFYDPTMYEVLGKLDDYELVPIAPLKDIQGNNVRAGDTIAYAFAGASSRHLGLFEVQSINGPAALCRSKSDGAVVNLGVFEERAIKIKE
jgi:hypothetical protein